MTAQQIAVAIGGLGASFLAGLLLGLRVGFKLWRVTYLEAPRRSWSNSDRFPC